MGLFSRGSQSDDHHTPAPDLEAERAATNGQRPSQGNGAAPIPEALPEEPSVAPAPQPAVESQPEPAVEPEPEPTVESQPEPAVEPEPEPTVESKPEPARAVSPPPSNPADPDPEEDGRLTVTQALAPSREASSASGSSSAGEEEKSRRAQVISFANQKGGVAKTTSTLNLAVAFAESGHDVLCVDLDPQGNLTMSQGVDPDRVEKSMYDVLVNHIPISEVVQHREIDIAVASIDLAGAEIAMSTQIGRERSLEKALSAVEDDYDFVCIDTPPSLGLLTINALTASDKVIVPVQCEYLSMRGLVQLQNTLEMIQENLNPKVKIEGILPTMLDSRTVHAKEAVEILEENFGELVFKSRIRKAIKFAEAPVRGASVLKYDPKGNAANYYRDLAKEVLDDGAS
jgi:chromosome partitioning protein